VTDFLRESVNPKIRCSKICTIQWVLLVPELSSHVSLEALDIRQRRPFLGSEGGGPLTDILLQILLHRIFGFTLLPGILAGVLTLRNWNKSAL
jgi:hypothetical protein